MSPKVNELGAHRQVLEALTGDRAQTQLDLLRCRCPRCNRFGIVSGTHEYYGIIYRCICLPVLWVISPETGEKIEEVKP